MSARTSGGTPSSASCPSSSHFRVGADLVPSISTKRLSLRDCSGYCAMKGAKAFKRLRICKPISIVLSRKLSTKSAPLKPFSETICNSALGDSGPPRTRCACNASRTCARLLSRSRWCSLYSRASSTLSKCSPSVSQHPYIVKFRLGRLSIGRPSSVLSGCGDCELPSWPPLCSAWPVRRVAKTSAISTLDSLKGWLSGFALRNSRICATVAPDGFCRIVSKINSRIFRSLR